MSTTKKACCKCSQGIEADKDFADVAEIHAHIMAAINAKSKIPLTPAEGLALSTLSVHFSRIIIGSRNKETWENVAHLALSVAETYKSKEG